MIIKNCPAILKMSKVCDDYRTTRDNPQLCKDITDCLLKRIVDICIKEKDKGFVMSRYGMEVPVSQGYDLACRILKEFEIEEADE